MSVATLERLYTAESMVAGLPEPNYAFNYQPTYANSTLVVRAAHELLQMESVTSPEHIEEVLDMLAEAWETGSTYPVNFSGSCEEPVGLRVSIDRLADIHISDRSVIASVIKRGIHVGRMCNQNSKPRSNEYEMLADLSRVVSYMGDAINDYDPRHREPDPTRMVAAALQASALRARVHAKLGIQPITSHEALLLPFEQSFVAVQNGKRYLLSADIPWIGKRTNDPDGPHVELLSTVENAVGVKIGSDSDEDHIRRLARKLNPYNKPGKLMFMLRLGPDEAALDTIVRAIQIHAPEALVLFDIHGSTRMAPNSAKVRAVPTIISDIWLLAGACKRYGRSLNGLHLETQPDNSRNECVDRIGQRPTHFSRVDPGLNPRQQTQILHKTAPIFTDGK